MLKRRIEQMRRLWLVLVLTVLPVLAAALLRWIRIQHVAAGGPRELVLIGREPTERMQAVAASLGVESERRRPTGRLGHADDRWWWLSIGLGAQSRAGSTSGRTHLDHR